MTRRIDNAASATARVLVIEDDEAMRALLSDELSDAGYEIEVAATGALGIAAAQNAHFDVVVTDLRMPEVDGFDVIRDLKASGNGPHIIMITAFGSIDTAIKAVKLGAYDYITKPFELEQLCLVIDKALKDRSLQRELAMLRAEIAGRYRVGDMIVRSQQMRDVVDAALRIAASSATTLIVGESGTGKELIARVVHEHSSRRQGGFIAINLAAIPETLIESELFGHIRGAYTDANEDRLGVFEAANHGTIFLDEIGELALPLQAKLLRVLQEQEVRPVGSNQVRKIDTRVIAATNQDLDAMRRRGDFREDLYYRLNVIQIDVPPLRKRSDDILALAQHFLDKTRVRDGRATASKLSKAVERALIGYRWPGNVRELENVIERCVALCPTGEITIDDLPPAMLHPPTDDFLEQAVSQKLSMAELERSFILRVLADEGGNKTRTAHRLGLDRKTLYRKLEDYAKQNED